MNPLSFFGNIGCGKSTWAQVIAQYCGFHLIKENLQDILFLQHFWKDRQYAFHTQIGFYLEWVSLYRYAALQQQSLMDSSILSHHQIFSTYMVNHQILDKYEFEMCTELYNYILSNTSFNTIYLHCDIDVLEQRIKSRNRTNELHDQKYIIELQKLFWETQKHYCLPIIDISHLSPFNEKDVETVMALLQKEKFV